MPCCTSANFWIYAYVPVDRHPRFNTGHRHEQTRLFNQRDIDWSNHEERINPAHPRMPEAMMA